LYLFLQPFGAYAGHYFSAKVFISFNKFGVSIGKFLICSFAISISIFNLVSKFKF